MIIIDSPASLNESTNSANFCWTNSSACLRISSRWLCLSKMANTNSCNCVNLTSLLIWLIVGGMENCDDCDWFLSFDSVWNCTGFSSAYNNTELKFGLYNDAFKHSFNSCIWCESLFVFDDLTAVFEDDDDDDWFESDWLKSMLEIKHLNKCRSASKPLFSISYIL